MLTDYTPIKWQKLSDWIKNKKLTILCLTVNIIRLLKAETKKME